METAVARAPDAPPTLPAWLRVQADLRGEAVALRFKRGGIWHPRTWWELEREVRTLAAVFAAHGFGPGDALVAAERAHVTSRPSRRRLRPRGGWGATGRLPIDPARETSTLEVSLEHFAARFAFTRGEEEVGFCSVESAPSPGNETSRSSRLMRTRAASWRAGSRVCSPTGRRWRGAPLRGGPRPGRDRRPTCVRLLQERRRRRPRRTRHSPGHPRRAARTGTTGRRGRRNSTTVTPGARLARAFASFRQHARYDAGALAHRRGSA